MHNADELSECGIEANQEFDWSPKKRSAFFVVCVENVSKLDLRTAAIAVAVSRTNAGSQRFPRYGTGARNGASVSTMSRSCGIYAATARKSSAFLNVTIPVNEI